MATGALWRAACTEHVFLTPSSGKEQLAAVKNEQVREWLASTFTRLDSVYSSRPNKPTFKAVAQALVIGQYIDR